MAADKLSDLLQQYSSLAKQEHAEAEVDKVLKTVRGAVDSICTKLRASDLDPRIIENNEAPELRSDQGEGGSGEPDRYQYRGSGKQSVGDFCRHLTRGNTCKLYTTPPAYRRCPHYESTADHLAVDSNHVEQRVVMGVSSGSHSNRLPCSGNQQPQDYQTAYTTPQISPAPCPSDRFVASQ